MVVLEWVVWIGVVIVVYAYAGYPALVWLVGAVARRTVKRTSMVPLVTIITAAHNEASCIEATIRNKFKQSYPPDALEYIIISDGSVDGTDERIQRLQCEFPTIVYMRQEPRQGKTAALNCAVSRARGDIIVFADANSLYKDDALMCLVRNFSDPTVGYVTGKMVYVSRNSSGVSEGCGAYMTYENLLRAWETRAGSIVGVDGGVDAMRKVLYRPMDPADLPDFILPLDVVEQGFRVVYEPEAVVQEEALSSHGAEWNMRVRVALRAYHALAKKGHLFNPLKYGLFSWELVSHKLIRYAIGFFQLVTAGCSLILSCAHAGWCYDVLVLVQVVVYLAALIGWGLELLRISIPFFYVPYYLCLVNAASLVAGIKFFKRERIVTWKPREGREGT